MQTAPLEQRMRESMTGCECRGKRVSASDTIMIDEIFSLSRLRERVARSAG